MGKIKETIIVLAAIVTIISGIIGYINLAWIKDLLEKILEYKSIIITIIVCIAVIVAIAKNLHYMRKFFKWLLMKYFKFIWKITGIEKRIKEENARLEIEFGETKKQFEILKKEFQENSFYHLLKGKSSGCSNMNMEINIKSKTVKKTEKSYEDNSADYKRIYNRIDRFDEHGFEIIALGYSLNIPYKIVDYWMPDELEHNKSNPNKIHLYLKKAVVLYAGEGLELEDLQHC